MLPTAVTTKASSPCPRPPGPSWSGPSFVSHHAPARLASSRSLRPSPSSPPHGLRACLYFHLTRLLLDPDTTVSLPSAVSPVKCQLLRGWGGESPLTTQAEAALYPQHPQTASLCIFRVCVPHSILSPLEILIHVLICMCFASPRP